MINFNFSLTNPFSNRWDSRFTLSKLNPFNIQNHCIEFNGYATNDIINIEFSLTTRVDHAGFRIYIGLFGYSLELHYYNCRHWDNRCYCD